MRSIIGLYRRAFAGLGRDIWMLGLIAFINRAGTMVLPFLTLYYTLKLGYTDGQAGFLLLIYGTGSLAGSYVGGRLCGQFGNIPVLMGSLIASGLAFGIFPFIKGYYPLMVAGFMVGFFADMFRPAIMSAFAEHAREGKQARSFGFLRMAIHSGMAFGPSIGGLLAAKDYRLIFWADGITCFFAGLMVPVLFSLRSSAKNHAAAKAERKNGPKAEPLRDPAFMFFMILVLGLGLVIFQFMATYPLYLERHYQMNEEMIGLLIGFNALILIAFEMLIVHRLETANPLKVFGPGCFLTALGFAVLPLGSTYGFALIAMGIFSMGEMLALPFSNIVVAQRAGPNSGPYMGVYSAMFSLAVMIAPPLGIWLFAAMGAEAFWFCIGLSGVVIWLGTWLLPRVTRWELPENESESVPALAAVEPVTES